MAGGVGLPQVLLGVWHLTPGWGGRSCDPGPSQPEPLTPGRTGRNPWHRLGKELLDILTREGGESSLVCQARRLPEPRGAVSKDE